MKLREGNVFTGAYLSVHGGPHVTIMLEALDLTVLPLPPPDVRLRDPSALSPGSGHPQHETRGTPHTSPIPGPPAPISPAPSLLVVTSGGHHWRPIQTCSLDLTVKGPLQSNI